MSQENEIAAALKTILNKAISIDKIKPVGGGSISRAYAIYTSDGTFFLKANQGSQALDMFDAEKDGLKTLKTHSQFAIPQVSGSAEVNGVAYLLMELIDLAPRQTSYWQELGQNLAELHKVNNKVFGYHRSNYIGSLPQSNKSYDNWGDFFINERMSPMIRLARDQQLVDHEFVRKFHSAMPKIIAEMPVESPALIHGDLWSGNLMVDNAGRPTIIDPAVYFGHREMDIAFSQMFGGFSDEFYRAYNEAYPMEPGFSDRAGLYNLYPYLVHLNLFGHSYFGHIDYTVRKFT